MLKGFKENGDTFDHVTVVNMDERIAWDFAEKYGLKIIDGVFDVCVVCDERLEAVVEGRQICKSMVMKHKGKYSIRKRKRIR